MTQRVVVVGGGLAGLAAASALASAGRRVVLLESRDRLGGRAGSFRDASTGKLIDACQHVGMGCCTALTHFWRAAGVAHLLRPQPRLYFMTPDRRVSAFAADPLPAPFHLSRSFLSAHFLSLADKARIALGLARLQMADPDDDRPFGDWLRESRQPARAVRRFWGLVLVSALNEEPERVGLKYARKVFVDAFLRSREGFVVEVPAVPLGRLYGDEMLARFARDGVEVRLGAGVRRVVLEAGRAVGVELRDGARLEADAVVCAVPHDRLPGLLPEGVARLPYFADALRLETSPIVGVHLWYDRQVMTLPHVVLIDCLTQWAFDRGGGYVQAVVSAARPLRPLGHDEIARRVAAEVARLFPRAAGATLLRSRVVTEANATFSPTPGADGLRPAQASPVPGLAVAGDWTRTGWPATMEGAVRSGYLAAEAVTGQAART